MPKRPRARMSMEGALPEQGESQRIGHLADKCFRANCPNEWLPTNLAGTDDFGFDYQVQTTVKHRVTDVFRVQLKGKYKPEVNSTGEFFSVRLKASTVRYYARATEPILLVLADLSVDKKRPANCPLYFGWVHNELRRINERGVPPKQKFITLQVPIANRLTETIDLSAELARYRQLAQVGEALDVVAERSHPGLPAAARANLIETIPRVLARSSPVLIQAMTDESGSAWPEAPTGSFPWYLHEAAQKVRVGDAENAAQSLAKADLLIGHASDSEVAEYWYLTGRLRAISLEDELARDAYARAATLSGDAPKHVAAWAETELRLRHSIDEQCDLSDVIARLSSPDPLCRGVRARLLATEGRYPQALEVARQTPGGDGWSALAIIYTMQADFESALDACSSGLREPNLRDATRQLFFIVRARAHFNLALGGAACNKSRAYLPSSGPAGSNVRLLLDTWSEVLVAAEALRSSGWPSSVEFLADIWGATASMLGKERDALPLLAQAAAARPTLPILQSALESVAAQCGDFKLALTANARQPYSETKTMRRVSLLHFSGQHRECVELFEAHGSSVIPTHEMFGFAVSMAILSADRIVRPDFVAAWQALLDSVPELAGQRALQNYFFDISKNLLAKDAALARLEECYEALGKPLEIALHFFHELDATDKNQAEKCVAVAQRLTSERMLHCEGAIHLAQALATLSRWPELLELSVAARTQFESNERFIAIEAMALDRLGRSTEALDSVRNLLAAGSADVVAANTYINIVVRCGFTEEAIRTVESILAGETDPLRQMEALRLLFNLVHHSDPFSSRGVDIAWRLGMLASPDDEAQEGLFLILMFAATLHANLRTDDTRIREFQERLKTFTNRFPESKILKAAHFPADASPETLIRMLKEVAGVDDDQVRWRERMERQLRQGVVPVPYAWRPRHVIGSVPDIPTLWAIGKASKPDERQFHLVMAMGDWKPTPFLVLGKHVPLLDLITLLVVSDLGIFELLFEVFPKIAIGQATLVELARLLAPMSGSPLRERCADLQSMLKGRFAQIMQPWAPMLDDSSVRDSVWASEEVKQLVAGGQHLLYSDDAIFRLYCSPPSSTPASICTLDVLSELERRGLLSTTEVGEKYAVLCSWHVGLVIHARYQVAVLPDALGTAKSVSEGIDILRASPRCAAVFDEIWDPRKPYDQLVNHGAALLREFIADPQNKPDSVAALIGFWALKARLHKDAPHSPLRALARIALSAVAGANTLPDDAVRRLWTVYLSLVAVEHGDMMDEAKEREAIMLAGELAAGLDHRIPPQGEKSFYNRLAKGLTDGTSDADAFSCGYNKALHGLAEKARGAK